MEFDVLLPSVVFIIVAVSIFLYQKIKRKFDMLFEDREFRTRDTVLMVLSLGLMSTTVAVAPSLAVQIFFIFVYSYMMFFFAYVALQRWYIAILAPAVFITVYFTHWDLLTFNLFAMVFAIIITVYLGTLFSWKTTWIFAILLTLMDVIQVFVTGFMIGAATKMLELKLPAAVILPTYPAAQRIVLGLGDIFFAGLLSIQTTIRHGQKFGILTAMIIAVTMFFYEIVSLNTEIFAFFPATVIIIAGWIATMGTIRLVHRETTSTQQSNLKIT